MIQQRPQFASLLDFVEIDGFENPGRLDSATKNIDAVIHVASVCKLWEPGAPKYSALTAFRSSR